MDAFRLVWALIRIPRLFASLLLFPVLMGLFLIFAQLVVISMLLQSNIPLSDTTDIEDNAENKTGDRELVREFVFGAPTLPALKICRWEFRTNAQGKQTEQPMEAGCKGDRLDVAIHVPSPATFDAGKYVALFAGNTERLHICKTCRPDVVINLGPQGTRSQIYSVWGMMVLALASFNDKIEDNRTEIRKEFRKIQDTLGEKYLYFSGLREPIPLNSFYASFAIIINIASLVVVALWLALKAHRKVLDYFARNGALLPMVAATGKGSFYLGIWLLTLIRVGAFLIAAIPLSFAQLFSMMKQEYIDAFFVGGSSAFALWSIAMVSGFALATTIGSIADLKQRHNLFAFAYRYLPLLLSACGALIWVSTFVFEGTIANISRAFITSLPVVGLAPIIVAPVVQPALGVLVAHSLLAVILLLFTLKWNARWFAAHLEEL